MHTIPRVGLAALLMGASLLVGPMACEQDGGGPPAGLTLDGSVPGFDASRTDVQTPPEPASDAAPDAEPKDAGCVTTCGTACSGELCLPSPLIAYWRADGDMMDSAPVIADASGGHHGAFVQTDAGAGAATYGQGIDGQAFAFSGVGHVSTPSTPDMALVDEVSLAAWVRPTEGAGPHDIAGKDGEFVERQYFMVFVDNYFRVHVDTAQGFAVLNGQTTFPLDAWHHVAMTYAASTAKLTVYVDGVLDAESVVGTAPNPLKPGTQPFRIGGGEPALDPYYSFYWKGAIDEVELYGRALTAAEVGALAQQHAPAPDGG